MLALELREVPVGHLETTFLSIGQGDAALVRWPDGRAWLIDGGPPSEQVLQWLRREGIDHLDAIFLSHPDSDHLGGVIPVAEALPVGAFWAPRPPASDEPAYAALWAELTAAGVTLHLPGDSPPQGAEILHPSADWEALAQTRSDNDESLVVEVRYRQTSLLFTGDIEAGAEAWLSPQLSHVSVVKVAHHGSRTSSTAPFVAATSPDLAVISVGLGNPFGHPNAEALARWAGTPLARTDQDGTVKVDSDGHALAVQTWRPGEGWTPWVPHVQSPPPMTAQKEKPVPPPVVAKKRKTPKKRRRHRPRTSGRGLAEVDIDRVGG